MALTIDDLDQLETAIGTGILTVKYTDKEVTYRSMAEMKQAREFLRKKLGLVSSGGSRMNISTHKGLGDGGAGNLT